MILPIATAFATTPRVTPVLEGVSPATDGTWVAWFGAQNLETTAANFATGNDNKLTPAIPAVVLPTAFAPGRSVALFSVPFDGTALTWTLNGVSVTATSGSPVYSPVGDRLAALVRHRPQINGKLDGSAEQFLGEAVTLNSGAIITGDLLVPGVPSLVKNGTPTFSAIVTGTGAATPTGYQVMLNGGSTLRYLVTRKDAPAMPVAEAPISPTGTRSVNLNTASDPVGDWATLRNLNCNGNSGSLTVPAGAYGTFSAGGNWELKLGTAGATQRAIYSFQSINLNSVANFKILGPVELRIGGSFTNNGLLGDASHPDWLLLKLSSGGLNLNSGSKLYGQVVAPQGTVQINGNALLVGNLASDQLTINSGGELRYTLAQMVTNQPPAGVIANVQVAQNAPPYPIALRTKFTDPNDAASTLTFAVQSNSNPGLVVTAIDPATGILTLTFVSGGYGEANLVVRATDPGGLTGDAPFKVTVVRPNQPPSVAIVVPGEGTVVAPGTPVTISATASDPDDGVASVQFFAGTTLVGTTTAQPYSVTWTPTAIGTYSIVAAARDGTGALTTSSPVQVIVNAPPTISITAPSTGASLMVGSPVNVTLNVADAEGQLAGVELFVDGNKVAQNTTAPYGLTWTSPTIGNHTLTAKATDSYGAVTTSEPIAIFINQRPTVAITAPVSGAVLQGPLDITVAASATDPDGTVANLQVLSNGAPIGSATNGALSFSWSNVAAGTYTLTAVATDDRGATATSAPVTVTVQETTTPPANDLVEETNFVTLASTDMVIPDGAGTLTFTISNLAFDTHATGRMHDTFELALIDYNGDSLVPTVGTGRQAFFSLSEGGEPVLAPDVVTSVGSGGVRTISVNVSAPMHDFGVHLVARLINNDGDTTTRVSLGEPTFSATPVTANGTDPGYDLTPTVPADWTRIGGASGLSPAYGSTNWNDNAMVVFADVALHNDTSAPWNRDAFLVIDQISSANVHVSNADGMTPQGLPYIDYSRALEGPALAPGATSPSRAISFSNPDATPFTYRVRLFASTNHTPVWSTSPVTFAGSGHSYTYSAVATDADNDPLTYSVVAGPAGLVISPSGVVTWTVPASLVAAQVVTLRVTDGRGGQADQTYSLSVGTIANRPPTITSTPIVDAWVNAPYNFQLVAQDPDGDGVTFTLLSGPAGLTIGDAGVLSWTPTLAQLGTQSVSVKADDGNGGTTSVSFLIGVNQALGNHAPIFTSIAPTTFSLPASGTNTIAYNYQARVLDPDGDLVSFALTTSPPDARIDAANGTIWWTPLATGPADFTISASDSRGGSTTQSFTVDVQSNTLGTVRGFVFHDVNGNHNWDGDRPAAPTDFASPFRYAATYYNTDYVSSGYGGMLNGDGSGQVIVAGVTGRVTKALLYWADLTGSTDPLVGANVRFSGLPVSGLPLGPSPFDTYYMRNYVADVTPLVTGNGNYSLAGFRGAGEPNPEGVSLMVFFDDGNPANNSDVLLYHGNYGNSGNPGWDITLSNINYTAGKAYMEMHVADGQNFGFHDEDDGSIYVNGSLLDHGAYFPGNTTPRGPYWNPGSLWDIVSWEVTNRLVPGSNTLHIQHYHDFDYLVLVATVFKLPGGSAPEAGLGGWTVYADENGNGVYDANEPSVVTAPDGSYALPSLSPGDHTIRVRPVGNYDLTAPAAGAPVITLAAGQVVSDVDLGVHRGTTTAVNNLPVITSTAPIVATAGSVYRYNVLANDPDHDPLTYTIPVAPAGMIIDPTSGYLVWVPGDNQTGIADVILQVADDRGGSVRQNFRITVGDVSTGPAFTSNPPLQAVAGLPYEYLPRAQDSEAGALTFTLVTAPPGATTFDPVTGQLDYSPTTAELGAHTVVIKATNSHGVSSQQTYTLTVVATAENHAPVITSIAPIYARIGQSYIYPLQVHDVDGDPLSVSLTTAPTGMTRDASTGYLLWTPTAAAAGSHNVVISVSDGRGDPVLQSFAVQVVSATTNHNPIIDSTPRTGATKGHRYAYDIAAHDPDGDTLVYSIVHAPLGASIDPVTGTLRWTPRDEQTGAQAFTVRAVDNFGGLVEQSFTVTLRSINVPPAFTSIPLTQATINLPYTYELEASDVEGDTLTFTLLNGPDGMTLDPETNTLHWTPLAAQEGTHPVQISVDDGQGGTALQAFTVAVFATPPATPPILTTSGDYGGVPNEPYTFQVHATDPNGGTVTYSVSTGPDGLTVNPQTGVVTWPSAAQGTFPVTIVATNTSGDSSVFHYDLVIAPDQAPVISSSPVLTAAYPGTYNYLLAASDPDGDPLTYTIVDGPAGMTIDSQLGVRWIVPNQIGATFPVSLRVSDGRGRAVTQAYTLTVAADTEVPHVAILSTDTVIAKGGSITFQVIATDNGGVQSLNFTVAGEAKGLQPGNITSVTFPDSGFYDVVATATDASGLTGTATLTIRVTDPADQDGPDITIDTARLPQDGFITAPTDLYATITDSALHSWRVEIARVSQVDLSSPAASNAAYKVIATGAAAVTDSVVARIDTTILANDSYFVRVVADDNSGNIAVKGVVLTVGGNLKLGRLLLPVTDLTIPIDGIPIVITRVYDSLEAGRSADFGQGWYLGLRDPNIQESVPIPESERTGIPSIFGDLASTFKVGTRVTLTGPDGRRSSFRFSPIPADLGIPGQPPGAGLFGPVYAPAFTPEPGVHDKLEVDLMYLRPTTDGSLISYLFNMPFNPSQYRLTTKDGHVYRYNQYGGLVDVTDRNHNVLTYTHNGIFSSSGAAVTFERDSADRIIKIIDPAGGVLHYEYNPAGELSSFTDQAGVKTSYTYLTEPAHYLNKIIDALGNEVAKTTFDGTGRLSTVADARNNVTTILYDVDARTETRLNPLYNAATPDLNKTVTTYDKRGNITRNVNEIGSVSSAVYDANDNVLEKTPPCGCTTKMTYDAAGNVLSTEDPLHAKTYTTFDANNNPLTQTDALGHVTYIAYDANSNLTSIQDPAGNLTRLGYWPAGGVKSVTDALGHVTQFGYDQDPVTGLTQAKPSQVLLPDGKWMNFSYNATGGVSYVKDENGNETFLGTDDAGKLLLRTDAAGYQTSTTYTANGQVESVTDPLGATTANEYDAAGNLVKRYDPNSPDHDHPTTQWTWDELGRLKNTTDALGHVTTKNYRADGVVTSIVDANGHATNFEYDTNGRRTALIDPDGNRTEFTYDGRSRVLTQKDPLGKVTATSYDLNGNLTSITDRLNRIRQFTYDANDRLTKEKWLAAGTGAIANTIAMSYNTVGKLGQAGDSTGTLSMTYDIRNRLSNLTASYAGRAAFELSYLYNQVGQDGSYFDEGPSRFNQVTEGGHVAQVTTQLDARNLPRRIGWTGFPSEGSKTGIQYINFERNSRGDVTGTSSFSIDSDFVLRNDASSHSEYGRGRTDIGYTSSAYNVQGDSDQLKSFGDTEAFGPLGIAPDASNLLAQGSDSLRRLTSVDYEGGFGENYTHDAAGQLFRIDGNDSTSIFSYDATGQLVARDAWATDDDGNPYSTPLERYTYDAAGNRSLTGDQTEPNVIGAGNRILSDAANDYGYDDEGNTVTKTTRATGETWTYTYDHRNRMTAAVLKNVFDATLKSATYTYDALDRRIAKTVDGAQTLFQYNGDTIWSRTDPDGTTQHFLTDGSTDGWLGRTKDMSFGSTANWYQRDRLGTIVGTDGETRRYDSFGNLLARENVSVNENTGDPISADPLGFTGREFDEETGLYYFRARYYDPVAGRFQSEDPESLPSPYRARNTEFNPYRYTMGNPLAYIDPSGRTTALERDIILLKGAASAAALGFVGGVTSALYSGCGFDGALYIGLWGAATGATTFGAPYAAYYELLALAGPVVGPAVAGVGSFSLAAVFTAGSAYFINTLQDLCKGKRFTPPPPQE